MTVIPDTRDVTEAELVRRATVLADDFATRAA